MAEEVEAKTAPCGRFNELESKASARTHLTNWIELNWEIEMESVIDFGVAGLAVRAARASSLMQRGDELGREQIGLYLSAGDELIALKGEVAHGEWAAFCAEHFPNRAERTLRMYMQAARWVAENPAEAAAAQAECGSWRQLRDVVEAANRPERPVRARVVKAEQPAVQMTGISLSTAKRLVKLQGMCSDDGPEGETARGRVLSLTGVSADEFYGSARARGTVLIAGKFVRENQQWVDREATTVADSLVKLAAARPDVDLDQLIADFAATVREKAGK